MKHCFFSLLVVIFGIKSLALTNENLAEEVGYIMNYCAEKIRPAFENRCLFAVNKKAKKEDFKKKFDELKEEKAID